MRAISSTLFVCVNTGVTENAGMENARRSKSDSGKPVTDTHYWIHHLTKTHTSGPSKPKPINFALRHQRRYVIQFKIIIILITTFHSVRVKNKLQSVSNAAYNFPGTYCNYSATGRPIRNWATQQTWLDCFFGFVACLAVQRLQKFFNPTFPVPRFLLPRYTSASPQHSTLHLYEPPATHYDCEIVHSMHLLL